MLKRMNREITPRLETLGTTEVRTHTVPAANQASAEMNARRLRRQRRESSDAYRVGHGWGVSLW